MEGDDWLRSTCERKLADSPHCDARSRNDRPRRFLASWMRSPIWFTGSRLPPFLHRCQVTLHSRAVRAHEAASASVGAQVLPQLRPEPL